MLRPRNEGSGNAVDEVGILPEELFERFAIVFYPVICRQADPILIPKLIRRLVLLKVLKSQTREELSKIGLTVSEVIVGPRLHDIGSLDKGPTLKLIERSPNPLRHARALITILSDHIQIIAPRGPGHKIDLTRLSAGRHILEGRGQDA